MNTEKVTLIIPLKIDSDDRKRNIDTILSFNLKNNNFKFILKEVDNKRKYFSPLLNNDRIIYMFEQSNTNYFYRTKILNDMLLMVKTEYVVNYDCDILIPNNTINEVIELLKKGNDLVFPYKKGVWLTGISNNSDEINIIRNTLDNNYLENIICKYNKTSHKGGLPLFVKFGLGCIWTTGGVQFFKTKSYIDGFGENENFIDWGPEDQERLFRFYLLGFNVAWIDEQSKNCGVAHLDHQKSEASSNKNEYNRKNHQLWDKITKTINTKQKMLDYIKTCDYITRFKQ